MKTLILKLFNGHISPKELERLKKWLSDPSHRSLFKTYIKNDFKINVLLQEPDVDKALEKTCHKIKSRETPVKTPISKWYKYAAIFVGTIALGLTYPYIQSGSKKQQIATDQITLILEDGTLKVIDEQTSGIIADKKGEAVVQQMNNSLFYNDSTQLNNTNVEKISFNELIVPFGKIFELHLSDGTHIFLNSGSKLKYPVQFPSKGNREVFLDGEAYFTVAKNSRQPFIVSTENMKTSVLGTQFNMSSYKNENNTSTVLVEGAVEVTMINKSKATRLTPGERAVFEDGDITVDKVNVEKHIAWTKNQLYFVDDRFELIIKELERHFNVTIQCDYHNLNKKLFTGTFDTENLQQILTSFQLNTEFVHQRINDNVLITKENSNLKQQKPM